MINLRSVLLICVVAVSLPAQVTNPIFSGQRKITVGARLMWQ